MKNFLIDFFRPLDNLIFNYFVKIGAVKCIDPGTAIAIGSNILGGIFGSRSAKKAASQRAQALQKAYSQFRDPSKIIGEAYTTGIYGEEPMQAILGRELDLIPQFQELQRARAFGAADITRDIQEESKLRQLGLIGQYGDQIRSTLEDPRLARVAEAQMDIAERAAARAQGPLSPEVAREATQTAYATAPAGRERDASGIAAVALSRRGAQQQSEQFAQTSLGRAMQASFQAKIDPYQFMFGTPSAEEKMATSFLGGALAPQVTDPGYAFNLGQMADQRRAQAILGQGLAKAQGTAASGQILGKTIAGIGSSLGNLFKPQAPTTTTLSSIQETAAPMLQPMSLQYNMPTTGFTGGGFTFGPTN
jgi:hypothetical protein